MSVTSLIIMNRMITTIGVICVIIIAIVVIIVITL